MSDTSSVTTECGATDPNPRVCPQFGDRCNFGDRCRHKKRGAQKKVSSSKKTAKNKINPPKRHPTIPFNEINGFLEPADPVDWESAFPDDGQPLIVTSRKCHEILGLMIDWSEVTLKVEIGEDGSDDGEYELTVTGQMKTLVRNSLVRDGYYGDLIARKYETAVEEEGFEDKGTDFFKSLVFVSSKDVQDILNDRYDYPEEYEDGWFLGIVEGVPGVNNSRYRKTNKGKKVYTTAYWFPRWPKKKYILSLLYTSTSTKAFSFGIPDQ